jgi:Protein of unknown function (DUF3738)
MEDLVFAALQEQLGLKLERGKHSIDYLVVDQVERVPTGNRERREVVIVGSPRTDLG